MPSSQFNAPLSTSAALTSLFQAPSPPTVVGQLQSARLFKSGSKNTKIDYVSKMYCPFCVSMNLEKEGRWRISELV